MKIHSKHHARKQLGASLIVVIILFPIVISLYLVIFTRLEILMRETQRREQRLQARLLAESALTILQQKLAGSEKLAADDFNIGGALTDRGRYQLLTEDRNTASTQVQAVGEVEYYHLRTTCAITAEVIPVSRHVGKMQIRPLKISWSHIRIEP